MRYQLSKYDLSEGYFVFDETELDKSYAKKIKGLGWIYSHLENGYIFGLQIVVLIWTNGKETVPIAWKIYKKNDKDNPDPNHKTKIDLAIELLDYAFKHIGSKPRGIIFDSFYSAEKILKYASERGLIFYSQVSKTRLMDGKQVRMYEKGRPRWIKIGRLKGGIEVVITRKDKKYFITNDISLSGKQIRRIYSIRWNIEGLFRFCKDQLDMEGCQMRDLRSQNNNIGVCFYLHFVLQDNAEKTQMTMYEVKEQLLVDRNFSKFPDLQGYKPQKAYHR